MEFKFELAEEIKEFKRHKEWCWDSKVTPTSHIYISYNKQRLLEVVNLTSAFIYEIDDAATEDVFDKAGKYSHKRV